MIINQDVKDYREQAKIIRFSQHHFVLETHSGRKVQFSYSVSPRLLLATQAERESGELMPGGYGIEWEVLNEHLSIDGLIQGKVSMESWRSVYEWYELKHSNQDISAIQDGPVVVSL